VPFRPSCNVERMKRARGGMEGKEDGKCEVHPVRLSTRREAAHTFVSPRIKIKARRERTISLIEAFNRNEARDTFVLSSPPPAPRGHAQCTRLWAKIIQVPSHSAHAQPSSSFPVLVLSLSLLFPSFLSFPSFDISTNISMLDNYRRRRNPVEQIRNAPRREKLLPMICGVV